MPGNAFYYGDNLAVLLGFKKAMREEAGQDRLL
jgi:hypothetical protein